jgi:peroxisomal membrane protein 4
VFDKIVLYLFSRVVMALVKLPVKRELLDAPQHTYPIFAAVIWGAVMVSERDRTEKGGMISLRVSLVAIQQRR